MLDSEVRHMAISLLTAPTERDAQTRVGASDLANGCRYCLACALRGISRDTPMTDRAYLGRVLGTALHTVQAERANGLASFARTFPGAIVEQHMPLTVLGSYGPIGSTPDLLLPSERHGVDWKGSTRKKIALLRDYLAISAGLEPIFGRKHEHVKLSETAYAEEMVKQEYKVTGYYAQGQQYARAANDNGIPIDTFSLVFVNRDGTGWFDNPALEDYENPKRMQDVFVLSFDYDPAHAEHTWQRAIDIWNYLESGGIPSDFESHPLCFPCGFDRQPAIAAPAAAAA